MKKITYLLAIATLTLASCNVNDPIYDSAHPDKGKITLTADWTNRTTEIEIPSGYDISVAGYGCTLSGDCNTLNNLFAPGTYTGLAWSTADKITVSGSTATVAVAGGCVDAQPGWLFTACDNNVVVEKGKHHQYTATMCQQVRQLTIDLTVKDGDANRIQSITGELSGIASQLDMTSDEHTAGAKTIPVFTRTADKLTASVRLLGIVSTSQKLTLNLTFADGTTQTIEKEVNDLLTNFNSEKHKPMTLTADLNTPVEAGFEATITAWEAKTGSSGIAN